jgi:hypothetical protein
MFNLCGKLKKSSVAKQKRFAAIGIYRIFGYGNGTPQSVYFVN